MKLKELIRITKKPQKPYPTSYNLLIAKDLCHALYQIFFIISLKEFIKLNANMNMAIKNVKHMELNAETSINI